LKGHALNLLLNLLAQTSTPTTGGAPPGWTQFVPILLGVAVLYFFVFRSKRNQDKARTSQLEKLKPGQRIQTIGGILGVITQVNDKEITVKVDETNNVKIKFTRNAIHRVQDEDKDKTETK
jgi:preprotein translocase subunit YajC